MLTFKDVYFGRIFIEEEFDNMLADYGVIVLGKYNKDLCCYENCLMSGVIKDRLTRLSQDGVLSFEGTVINKVKELSKLLGESK